MWRFNSLSSISTCTEKSPLKNFSCCATDFPSSTDFTCSLIFSPAFLRYNWQGIYIFKPQGKRNPELPRIIFYWLGTHFGIYIFNQLGDFDDQTVLGMWFFFFFFPSPFLFLFPSVNCFSTLFFTENHFLLTVDLIQRLRPSRPRQQSCVLGGGQYSHSGPFPSSSAKPQFLHLRAANKQAEFPAAGKAPIGCHSQGWGEPDTFSTFSPVQPLSQALGVPGLRQNPATPNLQSQKSPEWTCRNVKPGHFWAFPSTVFLWEGMSWFGTEALSGPGRQHWAGMSPVLSGSGWVYFLGSQSLSGRVGSAAPARSHLAQLWEMWRMDFTVVSMGPGHWNSCRRGYSWRGPYPFLQSCSGGMPLPQREWEGPTCCGSRGREMVLLS